MFAVASDYGPFAPVVGYAGAIVVTGGALFSMWGGSTEKWRPPDEDLPGFAQKLVLLLCGVGMVVQWYLAEPASIVWFIVSVVVTATACVVCFLKYSELLGTFVYTKKIATTTSSTRDVRILGGRDLLPDAEKKQKKLKVEIQALFEGAAYSPDLLWTRESRQWVKKRVLLYFILTLLLGTSALTGASFAVQVLLTKKAATSVIQAKDAPGLK